MSDIKEKVREYIDSEIGQDAITILAYSINATETTKDDEVVDNAAEVSEIVTEALVKVAKAEPSEKDLKDAIIRILKKVAEKTSTKWDDRAIAVLDMFM